MGRYEHLRRTSALVFVVEGHALGFDFESGFGLVQALGDLDLAPLPLGSRMMATLVHALRRRKARYGVATMCIGGGQGIAVVVERL